jgi:hypothetical protein
MQIGQALHATKTTGPASPARLESQSTGAFLRYRIFSSER